MLKRRDFLAASGTVAALGLLGGCTDGSAPAGSSDTAPGAADTPKESSSNTLERVGLQLSTITALMLQDFEGTLARVAEIGYDDVEFSALGFIGRPPEYVKQLLEQNGLGSPVGRISPRLPEGALQLPREEAMKVFQEYSGPDKLLDNVRYSLEGAGLLDQKFLNLPAIMPDQFQSLDQVKRNIEMMNQAGEICAEQGVLFGYHNHAWELVPVDGVVPYELMLTETEADKVGFQLDAYWIVKGGADLQDYLTRHAGRFQGCHMKDIDADGDFADVGDGLIDFPAFTRAAIAQGAEHFFVERDNPPAPAKSIERSHAYLRQMTY